MKVLLISPLPGIDPACGDITYTESLLKNPPQGVEYETYADAIARGALREVGTRGAVREARRQGRGICGAFVLAGLVALINRLRAARWLFWEPFRLFWVRPGEYDAIHLNVFSAGFTNLSCPLIISNAGPLRSLYTGARGYSLFRVKWIERMEILLGRLLRVNLPSYSIPQASRVIAFTHYLKCWYVERAVIPERLIDVIPVFLPDTPVASPNPRPRRVGFMSKDFAARGGHTLLKAWRIVRAQQPDAELVIRSDFEICETEAKKQGITVIGYVSREDLLERVLPSFDVFAYPTEFDGFYTLVEVMARGIAVATSDYQGIPEFVENGKSGLISPLGDADALANNILKLLEPEANAWYRRAARRRFEEFYAAEAALPRIRECYDQAIGMREVAAV
jgi:glycosyltransferase involved in cell wall biosynthesis